MTPAVFAAVVAAGAVGAVARAAIGVLVRRIWRRRGAGTLVVNLSGAFALGAWISWPGVDPGWLEVVGTGFLGAYTTFSTWMAEAAASWREGQRAAVVGEVALTLVLGLAAAGLGVALTRG